MSDMHRNSKVVAEIAKRKDVVIRFLRGNLGGYEYAEIRQYVRDESGDYQSTPKGITFNPELLDDMIGGLNALKRSFSGKSGDEHP